MMAKGDKSGWRRGAGSFSRSYPKIETAGEYKLFAQATADKLRSARKDVSGKVFAASDVNRGKSGKLIPA